MGHQVYAHKTSGLPQGTLDDIRLSGMHKDVVHVLVLFATNAFTPT